MSHQRRYAHFSETHLELARRVGGMERHAYGPGCDRDQGDRSLGAAVTYDGHPVGPADAEAPQAPSGIIRASREVRIGQRRAPRRQDGVAVGRLARMVDEKISDAAKRGMSTAPALRPLRLLADQQILPHPIDSASSPVDCTCG